MALPLRVPTLRPQATAGLLGFGRPRADPASPPAPRVPDWDRFAIVACALVGVICGIAQASGWIHVPFDARFYWQADLSYPGMRAYVYPPPLAQVVAVFHPVGWPLFMVGWTTLLLPASGTCSAVGPWSGLRRHRGARVAVRGRVGPRAGARRQRDAGDGRGDRPRGAPPGAVGGADLDEDDGRGGCPLVRLPWRVAVVRDRLRRDAGGRRGLGRRAGRVARVRPVRAGEPPDENGVPIVGPPLWIRLPIAVAIVAWGARTDRPWTVPIACGIALVGLYGFGWWSASRSVRSRSPDPRERREPVSTNQRIGAAAMRATQTARA